MNLTEIIKNIPIRTEWQERYHYFIPLFIENAIKYTNWEDWDQDVFREFFETNRNQCVSSLQLGYYTLEEQNKIKEHWTDISPLLKQLAQNQTEPNWELYKKISAFIRQFTSQNMQASTNRLIASLQPQLLCTIVTDDHLKILYKKLKTAITDGSVPNYDNGNWFKSSYNILRYFKEQLKDEDSYNIMTYPWQLKDEWMPKGYNKFYDILNELKKIVDAKYPQFMIEEINPDVPNYIWISDSNNIIGNIIAHFEIFKNRNSISVDIHFEDPKSKHIFHQLIKQLPEKLNWKNWHNSKSITYNDVFNINDEDIAEKLSNALVEMNTLIGDKIRYILHNINTLVYKNQLIVKEMNYKIKLLKNKYQIILQGPPGTGKTREAKLIAKKILELDSTDKLKDNEQFKLIQFHPSYTYEDFVRGIVAESKGDKIEYKNVNKTLGEFAELALKNYKDSQKIPEQVSIEKWLKNQYVKFKEDLQKEIEIDNEVLIKEGTKPKITFVEDDSLRVNRYSNENDSVLVKDLDIIYGYIGLYLSETIINIRKNELLSKSARSGMYYLYQNLIEKFKKYLEDNNLVFDRNSQIEKVEIKPYILVIDEINRANLSSVLGELIYALEYRGEEVESMYEVDGSRKLILPPNLYIIGTMNTADRSVGHIDYAIRRRFAFVDVLPEKLEDNSEIYFNTTDFMDVAKLFIKIEDNVVDFEKAENSDFLSDDFSAKDVALGHSYFIADKNKVKETEKQDYFKMKMKYEVVPILNEYLKDGVFNEKATVKIKEIEQRFA